MDAGTWTPITMPPSGEPAGRALLSPTPHMPKALASYFCVCPTVKMLQPPEKRRRSLTPPQSPGPSGCRHQSLLLLLRRVQHPAPIPCAREVLGPDDMRGGWGGISVPASGTPPPPPPACFTAVIPEDRNTSACFPAAVEQLGNVYHHGEPG